MRAVYHIVDSSAETKHGQSGVKLGSTWTALPVTDGEPRALPGGRGEAGVGRLGTGAFCAWSWAWSASVEAGFGIGEAGQEGH